MSPHHQHLRLSISVDHIAKEREGSMSNLCGHLASPHVELRVHHKHHLVGVCGEEVLRVIFITAVTGALQVTLDDNG